MLNRLHGLLRDLIPDGAPTDLTADKAAALLRARWEGPSSVTDSLSQPLVTIGASRRSQSEQKRMGDPTRGAGGVMRFRLRR
jgi:transposase